MKVVRSHQDAAKAGLTHGAPSDLRNQRELSCEPASSSVAPAHHLWQEPPLPRDPNSGGTDAHQDEQPFTSHFAVISWPQSMCWLYWWLHRWGAQTCCWEPIEPWEVPPRSMVFLAFSPLKAEKIKYCLVKLYPGCSFKAWLKPNAGTVRDLLPPHLTRLWVGVADPPI